MMRPVTTICMLLAAGSGLYLYQAKHQAQVETREIARLLSEASTIRQRIGVLVTEYQLENDPERIGEFATRFLPQLKPTQPTQFTTIAELDKRLPAIGSGQPAAADPNDLDGPPVPPELSTVPVARADPAHDDAKTDGQRTASAQKLAAPTQIAPTPGAPTLLATRSTPQSPSSSLPRPQSEAHPPAPRVVASTTPHDSGGMGWTGAPATGSAIRPGASYANQLTTPVVSPVFAGGPRAGYAQSPSQAPMGSSLGMARFLNRTTTTPETGGPASPFGSGG